MRWCNGNNNYFTRYIRNRIAASRHAQQRSVEDVALEILHEAFAETMLPSLDAVVAKIKSIAPNHHNLHSPQGSLTDVLRRTQSLQDFDLDRWNKEWAMVEAEMRVEGEGRT